MKLVMKGIGESKNNSFVRNKKTVFIGETGLLEDRLGDYLQILQMQYDIYVVGMVIVVIQSQ